MVSLPDNEFNTCPWGMGLELVKGGGQGISIFIPGKPELWLLEEMEEGIHPAGFKHYG
jgi:hypothetical protein